MCFFCFLGMNNTNDMFQEPNSAQMALVSVAPPF